MLKFVGAVLLTAAVAIAGCASHGPRFTQLQPAPAGQAALYIYRIQQVPRSMDLAPGVSVNGRDAGSLLLDGYVRVVTSAGPTDVRLKTRPYLWPQGAPLRSVFMDLRPGETRFIEFSVDSFRHEFDGRNATSYIGVSMREVDEHRAMHFLPSLNQAD